MAGGVVLATIPTASMCRAKTQYQLAVCLWVRGHPPRGALTTWPWEGEAGGAGCVTRRAQREDLDLKGAPKRARRVTNVLATY